ncbi:MAG TPA: hypothetical protein PKY72_05545 [Bacilli bacterium]|nr:hypothetical protein [Bacilli bacterium]
MKVKLDFITNSSSASFILYVTSTENNLKDFTTKWNDFVEHFININSYSLQERVKKYRKSLKKLNKEKKELEEKIKNGEALPQQEKFYNVFYSHVKTDNNLSDHDIMKMLLGEMSCNHISENTFSVVHSVTMLNNLFEDLPSWMTYLILLDHMKDDQLLEFGIKSIKLEVDEDS